MKLTSTSRAGDVIHRNLKMGSQKGFRNVSEHWLEHDTLSIHEGIMLIDDEIRQREDINATFSEMTPKENNGKFVLEYKDGRQFTPTPYALGQIGFWSGAGTTVFDLLSKPFMQGNKVKYDRDAGDVQTLAQIAQNGFRRVSDKSMFFRTYTDGTLRALLTDKYSAVDNRSVLEWVGGVIPGGRLSHWNGDADTIYGNVLVPDTLRKEEDSDYGGMISLGNSEIGLRPVSSSCSIFRAICINGCIWDQLEGRKIRKVHRGKINLKELQAMLERNIYDQLDLVPKGIDTLLNTKNLSYTCNVRPVVGAVAQHYKMSKKQASLVLDQMIEPDINPFKQTLFGLVGAVTKAGQELSPSEWVQFDQIGGSLMSFTANEWNRLITNASSMKAAEVDKLFITA